MATKLQELWATYGQSPWLDNLTRGHVVRGELQRLVDGGIRGVTSNPTIFAKAISGSADYDAQFARLIAEGASVTESYWSMVVDDIKAAAAILRPIHDADATDGFVSVELAPDLASETTTSIEAARTLHERIAEPYLYVKIPATPAGVPAIEAMVAEGRNINVTLIFSLQRYGDVIEAYLAGLERFRGDLCGVQSVASFFVSRVDTEVDRRLDAIGTPEALHLKGKAAVAQAKVAYQIFRQSFAGPRWEALANRGANLQRPLWASTSTKTPAYVDTLYVDSLIGPDSINTLPESTIAAFEDRGTLARTIDDEIEDARATLESLANVGVDMEDVGQTLEREGVAAFAKSFDDLLATLEAKRVDLSAPAGT